MLRKTTAAETAVSVLGQKASQEIAISAVVVYDQYMLLVACRHRIRGHTISRRQTFIGENL